MPKCHNPLYFKSLFPSSFCNDMIIYINKELLMNATGKQVEKKNICNGIHLSQIFWNVQSDLHEGALCGGFVGVHRSQPV